jgi:hypothetical protein
VAARLRSLFAGFETVIAANLSGQRKFQNIGRDHQSAVEALTEYTEGNHTSERVSRNLGYVPNGQRAARRDDAGRVTEYQLRHDCPAWESRARQDRTALTGLGPCVPLLGLPGSGDQA